MLKGMDNQCRIKRQMKSVRHFRFSVHFALLYLFPPALLNCLSQLKCQVVQANGVKSCKVTNEVPTYDKFKSFIDFTRIVTFEMLIPIFYEAENLILKKSVRVSPVFPCNEFVPRQMEVPISTLCPELCTRCGKYYTPAFSSVVHKLWGRGIILLNQ